jgi:hypothetical protein
MALEGTSPGRRLTRAQDGVGAVKRFLHVFSAPDGGVPEHVLRLAIGLRGRGWESWVAGPETASTYEVLRAAGIPIARLPLQGPVLHAPDDLSPLRTLAGLTRGRSVFSFSVERPLAHRINHS